MLSDQFRPRSSRKTGIDQSGEASTSWRRPGYAEQRTALGAKRRGVGRGAERWRRRQRYEPNLRCRRFVPRAIPGLPGSCPRGFPWWRLQPAAGSRAPQPPTRLRSGLLRLRREDRVFGSLRNPEFDYLLSRDLDCFPRGRVPTHARLPVDTNQTPQSGYREHAVLFDLANGRFGQAC
jgi:hypothetical protein